MTVTCLTANSGESPELDEPILELRSRLLDELVAGLEAAERAVAALDGLRSPPVDDAVLAHCRDGRDIATHIDGSIRGLRAAYAVAQMLFSQELPR